MSFFLTYRLSPKLSMAVMCSPRKYGGLGVLVPVQQQVVLQFRQLLPLTRLKKFSTSSSSSFWSLQVIKESFILPCLVDFLLYHSCQVLSLASSIDQFDYRLLPLFSFTRPPALCHLNSAFSLLFRFIERLSNFFNYTVPNAETFLALSLGDICCSFP